MQFLIFGLVLLLSLVLPQWVLYKSAVYFCNLQSVAWKIYIFLGLLCLGFSFPFTALLVRWQDNVLTSGTFYLASLWLGFSLMLLMLLLPGWLLVSISHWARGSFSPSVVGAGIILVAVILTAYGVWQAQHPQITRLDVRLHNLPAVWEGKTIVQLSDVHLGIINHTGFLDRLIAQINSLHPDLILITGDLFDGMSGDLTRFIPGLQRLSSSHRVYFATGNHEGYLGVERCLAILKQTRITVLNNERVDVEGLQIIGIRFPEHSHPNDLGAVFSASSGYDPSQPSILLYHTPTNLAGSNTNRGEQQIKTYWAPDTSMALAKSQGIDLQLSGHTHQGQIFPFNLLTRLIFGKYHYGLHGDGDFSIYTSSGTGTWGPPLRLGGRSEIVQLRLLSSGQRASK